MKFPNQMQMLYNFQMSDKPKIERMPYWAEDNSLPELNDETIYCIQKVVELSEQLELMGIEPIFIADALIEVSKPLIEKSEKLNNRELESHLAHWEHEDETSQ